MQTKQRFQILLPPSTHRREATCDEMECGNYVNGWVTVLDPDNPQHAQLFHLVRDSGRHYQQMRSEEAAEQTGKPLPAGLAAFVFPPGQQCFEKHTLPVGRPPLFVHKPPMGRPPRLHANGENFNEHFNEETDRIQRAIERG